ncbi:hypothetical protein ABT093_39205 [Kitasatospora sp. NPDC002551]|uniref:effector-associated constant component EACC1 n=1 Tax=unclassified Kitasatospora TaxID=2633591 RepID=UPI0033321084
MAQVIITIGSGAPGDGTHADGTAAGDAAVHELAAWLAGEPALRGRIRPGRSAPPAAGAMGPVSDLLIAVLEPGGAATVLVGGVVAWIRGRRERRTVTFHRADGTEVTVSTDQVHRLDAEELAALVRAVTEAIEPPGARTAEASAGPAGADGPSSGPAPEDTAEPGRLPPRDRAEEP